MTLTSSDAAKLLLSTSTTTAGLSSITVTVPAGQTSLSNAFVIQSLDNSGGATVTASAPAFASDIGTITLVPSGFVNTSPGGDFSTTAAATNTLFRVQPARLDPVSLNFAQTQSLRGGIGPISVPVTSGTPSVGVIATSPLSFSGGDSLKDTAFDPIAAGTTILTVGVPAGFSTPSNERVTTATVN